MYAKEVRIAVTEFADGSDAWYTAHVGMVDAAYSNTHEERWEGNPHIRLIVHGVDKGLLPKRKCPLSNCDGINCKGHTTRWLAAAVSAA